MQAQEDDFLPTQEDDLKPWPEDDLKPWPEDDLTPTKEEEKEDRDTVPELVGNAKATMEEEGHGQQPEKRQDPISLSWSGLSVVRQNLVIVQECSGMARPGKITAIMGHSGSGKTTLIKALTGRHAMTTGEVCLNGAQVIDPMSHAFQSSHSMAFVADTEVLDPTATCAESVAFSVRLRAPHLLLENSKVISNILQDLQLLHRADTQTRLLSAGERRRLSIAVELVVNPKLVVLDEPTSGLDSYNALELLRCLRTLADREGTTILLSIHHPGIEMWNQLDHLILLREGKLMLQTPTAQLPRMMANLGHPLPQGANPAEHLIAVSLKHDFSDLKKSGFYDPRFSTLSRKQMRQFSEKSLTRRESTASTSTSDGGTMMDDHNIRASVNLEVTDIVFEDTNDDQEKTNNDNNWTKVSHAVAPVAELCILAEREYLRITRNVHDLMPQLALAVFGGALFAIVFAGAASNPLDANLTTSDFFAHVGALFFFFLCSSSLGPGYMKMAINERPLFEREYRTGHYRIWTYIVCKTLSDMTILFVMAVIVTLIAFWAIGFQGRFWYQAFLFYVFGVNFAMICVAVVAIVREPTQALDCVGLVFLPNAMLSGFYVPVDQMPVWIRWASWLMPFTWSFRLALEEELSSCAVPRGQDENVFQCLDALTAMLIDNEYFYSETNATLYLQQTGPYEGEDAISEYIRLVAFNADPTNKLIYDDPTNKLIYDTCYVEGMQDLIVNHAGEDTCSITIATVGTAFANPTIAASSDPTFVETVFGYRLDYGLDGSNTAVVNYNLAKLANPEYDFMGAFANQTKAAQFVCETLKTSCDDEFFSFDSLEECTESMSNLPALHESALSIYAGNSTYCRAVHSWMAAEGNTNHCPHISYEREVDPFGKFKCSDENLDKVYRNFTEKELQSFEQVSARYGLGESQVRFTVDPSRVPGEPRDDCITDGVSTLFSLMERGDFFTDLAPICYGYAETNFATSEYRPIYWACIFAFLVMLRALTGYGLHRQTHRRV